MKKLSSLFGLLALVAVFAAGCVDEEPNYNKGGEETDLQVGYLALDNLGLSVVEDTDQNTDKDLSSTRAAANANFTVAEGEASNLNEYRVKITPAEGGAAVFEGLYSDLKTRIGEAVTANGKGLELPVGSYTVKAWSNKNGNSPENIQDKPSYVGSTPEDKPLRIVKGQVAEKVEVTCTLVNIKVTVEIDESLRKNQAGESILSIQEAWVNLGDTRFTYKDANGWDDKGISNEFDGQTNPVYFKAVEENNMLQFHFKATPKDGTAVTLNKNIPNVKGGHWRKIKIVGKHDTQGNLTFEIVVSTLVQDETIQAGDDAADAGTTAWAEDTMVDPDDAAGAPKVEWQGGDVNADIVVGASNPSANDVTIRTANKIASIALAVSTTNSQFAADAQALTVPNLCTTIENSRMLTEYGIPYGSTLVGQEKISFSLNGIMGKIRSWNGRYVFTFTMTDQKGFTTTQTLTFVVGDVPAVDNNPTIVGDGFNIEERQNIADYLNGISMIISAPNTIQELNVSINSDNANFMDEVRGMSLPETFDLCHITDTSAQWVGLLQSGGFPINDQVLGADGVTFTINSMFMGMLSAFAGNHDFTLKVVDATGASTTATLKLKQ